MVNQVENSSGFAMFYVVAMFASNMNGLHGERLRSGDSTLVRVEVPPTPLGFVE